MKLEGAILKALLPAPQDSGVPAIRGLEADLRSNSPVVKKALAMKLREARGFEVPEPELVLRMDPIGDTDYRAVANLDRFGLTVEEAHGVLESAFLAVGKLNSRVAEMRSYNALSGAIDDELPLFAGKFGFLAGKVLPGAQEEAFDRVMRVRELPTFDLSPPDRSFDVDRFLEVRSSNECVEFRQWLRRMRSATDAEIAGQMNTVRAKLGPFVHGAAGRAVRIAISAAISAIPAVGPVLGVPLSIIDSFLLERLLPTSGPMLFLSRKYPSLFRTDRAPEDTSEWDVHGPVRMP